MPKPNLKILQNQVKNLNQIIKLGEGQLKGKKAPAKGKAPGVIPYGPSRPGHLVKNKDNRGGQKGQPFGIANPPQGYIDQYRNEQQNLKNDKSGKFVPRPPLPANVAYALDQSLNQGFTGITNATQGPNFGGYGQGIINNLTKQTGQALGQGYQQIPGTEDLLQRVLQGSKGTFEPIAQQEIKRFNTQIIPSLAERFQSLGGQGTGNTSAFQGALGAAGNDLEERLAAMQQQFAQGEQSQRQNLLELLFGQGNRQNLLQQQLFGTTLGAGQANRAQGLQLLQNQLTQGLQPRHEYGFQPAPPSFANQFGQGLGTGTALLGGALAKYLTGGIL